MHARHAIGLRLTLVAVLTVLAGCGTLAKLLPGHVKTTSLDRLRVAAQPGANMDSATALDLVFVYDAASVAMLPKTGPEWFAQKAALQNGLGRAVDVVSLQVPPATVIASVDLPSRHGKAVAVFGFANYLASSGQGRSDLTRFHDPVIWLAPAQINVTEP
jgi:type VI secretion system protein